MSKTLHPEAETNQEAKKNTLQRQRLAKRPKNPYLQRQRLGERPKNSYAQRQRLTEMPKKQPRVSVLTGISGMS